MARGEQKKGGSNGEKVEDGKCVAQRFINYGRSYQYPLVDCLFGC